MSADHYDIIVTWPKTKPLAAYLEQLADAQIAGLQINYRVARLPAWSDKVAFWDHGSLCFGSYPTPPPRCYIVHSGFVRGWSPILYCCQRKLGEVDGWPSGLYIVRSPEWHPWPMSTQPAMAGFRGTRWFTEGVAQGVS